MKLRFFLFLILFAGGYPARVSAQLTVSSIAVGTGIENGLLTGKSSSFSSDVTTLYCLTALSGAKNNPVVKHIWYYNGKQQSSSEFVVRTADFKTWSSKKIWRTWKGNWRVDVVDAGNRVLASTSFTIK